MAAVIFVSSLPEESGRPSLCKILAVSSSVRKVNDDFAHALSRDRVGGQFGICVGSIPNGEARNVDDR
jgi:hypothetical protein